MKPKFWGAAIDTQLSFTKLIEIMINKKMITYFNFLCPQTIHELC